MTPPDWTDHTAHDPGITLVALFAYLADGLSYSVAAVARRRWFALAAAVALLVRRRRRGDL